MAQNPLSRCRYFIGRLGTTLCVHPSTLLPPTDIFPEADVMLCPALADYPECLIGPDACAEACQLRPDAADED